MQATGRALKASTIVLTFFIVVSISAKPAYAQPNSSGVVIFNLEAEGKSYLIPYIVENSELVGLEILGSSIVMRVETDQQESGSVELALPYDLIKSLWPQTTKRDTLESLEIFVSGGESLSQTITYLGSRVTVSAEFPARTEEILIAASELPARVPLLSLDVQQEWGNLPGSSLAVTGVVSGVETEENIAISINVTDSLDNVVTSTSIDTMADEQFTAYLDIPQDSTGGLLNVVGRIDLEGIPETRGYDYFYVNSPGYFKIRAEGMEQAIYISSNSSMYEPFLLKDHKILGILVSGGGLGIARATVVAPRDAIDGELTSTSILDGFNSVVSSNSTHSVIELQYADSESPSVIQVIGTTVIPEFGPLMALALAAGLIGAVVRFRVCQFRNG